MDQIERDMQREWEDERDKYERELQESHDGHQAIIDKIDTSKESVYKIQNKIKEVERNKVMVDTEIEGLREDKQIKLNQLRNKRASESQNA